MKSLVCSIIVVATALTGCTSRSEIAAHQTTEYSVAFHDWLAASRSADWGVTGQDCQTDEWQHTVDCQQATSGTSTDSTISYGGSKKAPPIAEPMYLSAYANLVTHNPYSAIKPLTHLVAADPAMAAFHNALALALISANHDEHEAAFQHAEEAVILATNVPQFMVTYVYTDRSQWKIELDGTARLTRVAASWLQTAGDKLMDMSGNAKKLGRLLGSLVEDDGDPDFPFVLEDYKKLVRKPSLALTRPDRDEFAIAQKAIVERIAELKRKLNDDEEEALEMTRKVERIQGYIEQEVALVAEVLKEREEARAHALTKMQRTAIEAAESSRRVAKEKRVAIEAEEAARQAREEFALIAKAEEEARKEHEVLLVLLERAHQVAELAKRLEQKAEYAARATVEEALAHAAERRKKLEENVSTALDQLRITATHASTTVAVEAFHLRNYALALSEALAADQLNADEARHMLGFLYSQDNEAIRDLTKAYVWFSLAGRDGDQISINDLVDLSHRMSPAQIVQARSILESQQSTPD
jgi:hypothetical protein